MLSHLFEVYQRILETLGNCCHAPKGSSLELFALEERLRIFQESNVISGDGLDEMLCSRKLAEGDSEVVRIVQSIQKIFVERMNVLEAWEAIEDHRQLLRECLLCVLHLSGIESFEYVSICHERSNWEKTDIEFC